MGKAQDRPQINVCNGGSIAGGTDDFVFVNNNNSSNCIVQWQNPKPPGQQNVSVPANGTSHPINCKNWPANTYPYIASNCGCTTETNPSIQMQ